MTTPLNIKAFVVDHSTLHTLLEEASAFASSPGIDVKTVGIELLEETDRIILTLGYAAGDRPTELVSVDLDDVAAEPAAIETAFASAMLVLAAGGSEVVCHEFFYDSSSRLLTVVFLVAV